MPKEKTEKKQRTPRKQYTAAFKRQLVELAKLDGKCKRDIAEEYDISESMLYDWIKKYETYGTFDKPTIRAAKETDVERLQKKIARLELENSILKDVALMLNNKPQKNSGK